VIAGSVLLGGGAGGHLARAVAEVLGEAGAQLADLTRSTGSEPGETRSPVKALVFDAGAIEDCAQLELAHSFLHRNLPRLERCGRVLILATPPEDCTTPAAAAAQQALEGLTRSLAKELGGGRTAQLLRVGEGAQDGLASTVRFLLSPRSAFITGQAIELRPAPAPPSFDWERPLAGRVALVTGAARGIGRATAELLAAEGARVTGVDVPALDGELAAVLEPLGARALALDITAAQAPQTVAAALADGVDVIVHNAGVTRDRTLAKMGAERWREVLEINLCAQQRLDELLLDGLLRDHGRMVCVSSMSAIAGNAGQSNYAASKAGAIGRVRALAPLLAERGCTANAVAPGFIETAMTAQMPFALRQAARRMSSLCQGGLPVDVAQAIGWLAHPGSGAVNGGVLRVCGGNLIGA
jgi:3-oxoacyl-[acyl-carrier protein] reductase